MDIVNDTNQDAKVRVAGGGSGAGSEDLLFEKDEDTSGWPVVPSKGQLNGHKPFPPAGPWTVCFAINGRRIFGEVPPRACRVRLTRAFKVEVD